MAIQGISTVWRMLKLKEMGRASVRHAFLACRLDWLDSRYDEAMQRVTREQSKRFAFGSLCQKSKNLASSQIETALDQTLPLVV